MGGGGVGVVLVEMRFCKLVCYFANVFIGFIIINHNHLANLEWNFQFDVHLLSDANKFPNIQLNLIYNLSCIYA